MAIDTSIPRTRRALLAGGIGGLVAVVASALGRVDPVRAGSDGDVVLGADNTTSSMTQIHNSAGTAFAGTGSSFGVEGWSTAGTGVRGRSTSGFGVDAWSDTATAMFAASDTGFGVVGVSNSKTAVLGRIGPGDPPILPMATGVYGYAALGAGSRGVHGQTTTGQGVRGDATTGTGVYGTSPLGVGVEGITSGATGVHGVGDSGVGVRGESGSGIGVIGTSNSWSGVIGRSNAVDTAGMLGASVGNNTGVFGFSGSGSPPNTPAKTGVYGYAAQDFQAIGVKGQTTVGTGVQGIASTGIGSRGAATTGTGVYASATTGAAILAVTSGPKSGLALRTVGRVRFDNSVGIATIAAGASSVTVTPGIDLVATSAVVATLQGSAGGALVERVSVNATTDQFTIYLNKNATAAVKVAWHVFG